MASTARRCRRCIHEGRRTDAKGLTPEDIWCLVDYVRSLPNESVSKPDTHQHPTFESQQRLKCRETYRGTFLEFAVPAGADLGTALALRGRPIAGIWPFRGPLVAGEHQRSGGVIDHLFMFILYLTGVIFVGTELALFWFMWKYDAAKNTEPVKYTHGSHTLEVVWTIIPAATLLFIAIYQMNAWADAEDATSDAAGATASRDADDVLSRHGRSHRPAVRMADSLRRAKDGMLGTPDDMHHRQRPARAGRTRRSC